MTPDARIKKLEDAVKNMKKVKERSEICLTNLGDVTGCTLTVNCPKLISRDQLERLRNMLKRELPEADHFLILCDGVDVSLEGEPEEMLTGQEILNGEA